MNKKIKIERLLDLSQEHQQLNNLIKNKDHILLSGLHPSQRIDLAIYLYHCGQDPVMISYSDREADEAYRAIRKTNTKAILIKSQEIRFYSIEAKNRSTEGVLIQGLFSLLREERAVYIITAEALLKKYIPKKYLQPLYLQVEVGQTLDKDDFAQKLVNMGYVREHKVEGVGMFAIRGGILDIFSPSMDYPLRIELFDDEVDSIRNFDVYTQKSIEKFQKADIIPSRSFLLPSEAEIKKAVQRMRKDIRENTSGDIVYDIERIERGQYFEGIEKYIDYFYPADNTLFDYIKKESIFLLNEPARIIERMEGAFEEYKDSYIQALEKGFAIKGQGKLLLSTQEVTDHLHRKKKIYNTLLSSSIGGMKTDAILSIDTRESRAFHGKLMDLLEEIRYLRKSGYMILISLEDDNLIQGIRDLLSDHDIPSMKLSDGSIEHQTTCIIFTKFPFAGGAIYSQAKIAIFTKDEIYSPQKRSSRKFSEKLKTKKIESFIELKAGDYVVHEEYGIGRFVSVEQRAFDEITKDYIKISYHGGDSLYLPLDQMSKIQRYIGNMKEDGIKLSKMGSNEWRTTKRRAKKIVESIAQDLVELYAKRESQKGHRFSEDTPWQREFESDFPFVETNDQLQAIQEVKKDMESEKIMDRLLCGDVGYGKTEVALRAVFKATMDSKQSAFLVPTTVLAQQHYHTFRERFRNFPIRVELLSRFRTVKDQEAVIDQLRTGEVDVLIGTHRILSKDILFRDLGLIVVDEEQRFGVKDKEKLKAIRNNCDVLSLSATPIPRTLHMSLSGIRDITTLEEPPKERRAVLTYVTQAQEGIISDAILREVERGGQVFFVYNRVQTIDRMYDLLTKLLPDVRIAVAHGQMSSRKLENVLTDFTNKEYDVLLCTTIIETGIDIGNANTIIVYDADRMGLSQLYQLRGRVGRTSRQGYAYFMYEKDKILSEVAEKRLTTIKEFTEFGSGFKVAMRDLEIRGAGTLLGETQHGHIADIGYELYVKMLDQSIKRLRGQEVEEEFETEIDIKVNAYIPSEYIEDEMDKIEIYKKIASIRDLEDKHSIEEEMEDRFSDIPFTVYALTDVAYLRSLGKKLKIGRICQKGKNIEFYSISGSLIVKKDFGKVNEYKLLKSIANYLEKMV